MRLLALELRMTSNELKNEKEVAYFAAGVEAWYATSLEHDKSIFALSGGGIGLLITLFTAFGTSSLLTLWLYGLAVFCFVACLVILLVIFRKNRNHIEELLVSTTVIDDKILKRLDLAVLCVFGVGVVVTAIVGVMSAHDSYTDKLSTKAKEERKLNDKVKSKTEKHNIANESFNGASNLAKSFSGAGNLRPQNSTGNQTPSPAPSTPPSGGNTQTPTPNPNPNRTR